MAANAKALPSVSIVIVAHNEERTIDACIAAAAAQDYANIAEIIVVDGHSSDRTPEIVRAWERRDPRVRLVVEEPGREHRGPSAARKLGIALASGEYVQLFNGDVTVEPHYVSRLVAFALAHDLAGTAGLRWNPDASVLEDFVNVRYWLSYAAQRSVLENPIFLSSDGALYRRADVLRVGNYDEQLIAGEDCDIGYRIVAAGGRLRYCEGLYIYHRDHHYQSLWHFCRQKRWYGMGAAQLATKYPFRYVAEANKVVDSLLAPALRLGLWLLATVVLGRVALPLACLPQLWLARQTWRLWCTGRHVQSRLAQAKTPTRVRAVCCWLYPLYAWLDAALYTIWFLRYIPAPKALYRKWSADPMFSHVVRAGTHLHE
jgi:glycosyltransferase involved in cell wall biosynthesis